MVKKIVLIVSCALMFSIFANAQSFKKTNLGVRVAVSSIEIEIQFYNPSTIRVIKSPAGKQFEKNSLSVIEKPQKTSINVSQTGDELLLSSEKIQVDLNLKNGKISFLTAGRKSMLNEKEDGVEFTDFNDAGNKTYNLRIG